MRELPAGCVIWVMGTFRLFSKTATWSGDRRRDSGQPHVPATTPIPRQMEGVRHRRELLGARGKSHTRQSFDQQIPPQAPERSTKDQRHYLRITALAVTQERHRTTPT